MASRIGIVRFRPVLANSAQPVSDPSGDGAIVVSAAGPDGHRAKAHNIAEVTTCPLS